MIHLKERYDTLSDESTIELKPNDWVGRPVIDLVPEPIQSSNVTLQVTRNTEDLSDEDLFQSIIEDGDTVTIRAIPRVAYPVLYFLVVQVIVPVVVGLALGYAINAIVNAISPSKRTRRDKEESPNYDFDTLQNTTRNGTPVQIVYGEIRTGGHILEVGTDYQAQASIMLGLSEGGDFGVASIAGYDTEQAPFSALPTGVLSSNTSIYINDNTAGTFTGTAIKTRFGTKDQEVTFTGGSTFFVGGVAILSTAFQTSVPEATPFTYTTINPVDAVSIEITFTGGLFFLTTGGAVTQNSAVIRVGYKIEGEASYTYFNGSSGSPVQESLRQVYKYKYNITGLSFNKYTVIIERMSDDDASINSVSAFQVTNVTEYLNDEISYTNKAISVINLAATESLSGTQPSITVKMKGIKVRVYTNEDSYTYAWTQNPVWIILDLLINKVHGLGRIVSISDIDLNSLLEAAAYCDELVSDGVGGTEARCQCDIAIDTVRDAWEWIYDIAQASFLSIFLAGGKYRIRADKASNPVMMFTPGNMSGFSIGYTPIKDRINYVEINYPDRTLNYTSEMAVAIDATVAEASLYVKETLDLIPVTRRSQAIRFGNRRVNANKLLTRYASWMSPIIAIRCEPNDIVDVAHAQVAWGLYSGLIYSASASSFVPDREITLESGTYNVRVFHTDGTFDAKQISSVAGTYAELGIVGEWSQPLQKYSPYSIGLVSSVVKQFKIVDMEFQSDFSVKISALEYNPLVYSDEIVDTSGTAVVGINPGQVAPDVTDLVAKERILRNTDGTLTTFIDAYWNKPISLSYSFADVYVKAQADAAWPATPVSSFIRGNSVKLTGNYRTGDALHIAVVSCSSYGVKKSAASSPFVALTLIGGTDVPLNVTGFTLTRFQDTLNFNWTANTDIDLAGYEIRQGIDWGTGVVLISNWMDNKWETNIFFSGSTAYSATYLIKAINNAGQYSTTAATVAFTVDPRVDRNVVIAKDFRANPDSPGSGVGDWNGTLTNFTKEDDSGSGAGTAGNRSIGVTTVGTQAVYETAEIDIGSILRSGVSYYIEHIQDALTQTWDSVGTQTWDSTFAQTTTWSGPVGVTKITSAVQIKYGNTSGSGSYAALVPGEYTGRYFRFKVLTDVSDVAYDGRVKHFKVTIDVPDIIEFQRLIATTSGAGVVSVVYTKVFTNSASIAKEITLYGGAQGDNFVISNESVTGFDITLYNVLGVTINSTSRQFNILCKGY